MSGGQTGNWQTGLQGFQPTTLAADQRATAPTPVTVDPDEPVVLHTFEVNDDRSVEVTQQGGKFVVMIWDDGFGFESGGSPFGGAGTRFDSEAEALKVARRHAGLPAQ